MLLWLKIALKESSFILRHKKYASFAWLATKYGGKARHSVTDMVIEGHYFTVPDALSVIWQYYEIYFKEYYAFDAVNKQPRIIDIGSNVGLSILYFKNIYPNAVITGYEADPIIYSYLKNNISKAISSAIELIHKAVWIHNDGIRLTQEGADGGSIIVEGANKIDVPSISFQHILAAETYVDMIKMDIEGAEIDVLAHASDQLHKVQNMFIEFHSYKGSKQRMAELLTIIERAGFRYSILDSQTFPNTLDGQIDLQCNIFCKRTI